MQIKRSTKIVIITKFCCLMLVFGIFYISSCISPSISSTIIRGISVEIHGENNEVVSQYMSNLNYIDDYLLPLAHKVVLTDKHVAIEANVERMEDGIGYTDAKNQIIYINTDSYDSVVLMHEFFHLFDSVNREVAISETKEFQTLVEGEWERLSLSDYGASSRNEIFVSIMLMYRYQPQKLMDISPSVFNYINTILPNEKATIR